MPRPPVIHSPLFRFSEFPNVVYVERGEKYLFPLSSFCNQSVNSFTRAPRHAAMRLRTPMAWSGIISHCYTNEIFKGSGLEAGGSDVVPGRRIRYDNQLRAIDHQLSRGFRELPVRTDHDTDLDLPVRAFKRTNVKRFTGAAIHVTSDVCNAGIGFLKFVFAEVTDKHLGIVQHDAAPAIENGCSVPRQRLMCFQIGDSYIHFLFSCQGCKSLEKAALPVDGRAYPRLSTFGIEWCGTGANVPKLRKQSQIRPEFFGLKTGLDASCEVFILIIADCRNLKHSHVEFHLDSDARLYRLTFGMMRLALATQ